MFKKNTLLKKESRRKIRKRIRKKIRGTAERPRVFVFKSNRYIYSQAIDDITGTVLAAASSVEKEYREKKKKTKNMEASKTVGEMIAKSLKKKKIKQVVFDRGVYPYHGRVKALAEAMRKEGLIF
ncbi:MAG: 50S ribosomal protein L18 [Candidatus Aminicenantaceae bacterium]